MKIKGWLSIFFFSFFMFLIVWTRNVKKLATGYPFNTIQEFSSNRSTMNFLWCNMNYIFLKQVFLFVCFNLHDKSHIPLLSVLRHTHIFSWKWWWTCKIKNNWKDNYSEIIIIIKVKLFSHVTCFSDSVFFSAQCWWDMLF